MSNTIKKTLVLSPHEYFKKHLEIINPVLPSQMTPKEIEVLAMFMSLKGEVAEDDRFGTFCRKKVKVALNLSNGGLANYLRSLKASGFITVNENEQYQIPFFLFPQDAQQQYEFKILQDDTIK